jgi:hypothetical protein
MSMQRVFGLTLVVVVVVVLAACEKKVDPGKATPVASTTSSSTAAVATVKTIITVDAGPAETIEVPEVRIRKDADTTVKVTWLTPKGTSVNDEAPFRVRWNRSDGLADAPSDVKSTGSAVKDGFKVKVRPMSSAPNATLDGELNIVVCDSATHSVCVPVKRNVELGFVIVKDANAEATVSIPLPEAKVN